MNGKQQITSLAVLQPKQVSKRTPSQQHRPIVPETMRKNHGLGGNVVPSN